MNNETFNRSQVISIIQDLLERPDVLRDATDNENTINDASTLLELAESELKISNDALPHQIEMACILMKVPETGISRLDEIIRKGRMKDFTMAAMQGLCVHHPMNYIDKLAKEAVEIALTTLAALESRKEVKP